MNFHLKHYTLGFHRQTEKLELFCTAKRTILHETKSPLFRDKPALESHELSRVLSLSYRC